MKREFKRYITLHGDYPLKVTYLLCIEIGSELTYAWKHSREAWLTIMYDDFSKRILAAYCSLGKPSYHIALLECIQRFNACPYYIVTDNSRSINNGYFRDIMEYGIVHMYQPSYPSRESAFKKLISAQVHLLLSKYKETVENCCLDISAPRNDAISIINSLNELFKEYFYYSYDTTIDSGLNESPRNRFQKGLERFGLIQLMPDDVKIVIKNSSKVK